MGNGASKTSIHAGHDILARYLAEYARARQMTDLERPWGLGDDRLDGFWMRLNHALSRDPRQLDKLVPQLPVQGRRHIVATLAPLIFALPLRSYPAELRAIRSGPRLLLTLRHLPVPPQKSATPHAPPVTLGEIPRSSVPHPDPLLPEPVGFLPAALTADFANYLKDALKFEPGTSRKELIVSTGGRRRFLRVTLLAKQRGVVVRFLRRVPSPADV